MKYFYLIISILLTFFAFFMSVQTGETSSEISSSFSISIYNIFISIFENSSVSFDSFHTLVRKLAHITEYFLLGVFWLITFVKFQLPLNHALIIGLLIACIDEGIQFFTPERGPSIIDLFLFDYSSYLLGHFLIRKWNIYKNKVS